MKRLLPILSVLVLPLFVFTSAKAANDDDWNISFYDNCGMPKNDSMRWIEEGENKFVRFQLRDKDYGGCSSDRMKRANAPYWERAELKQNSNLSFNKKYELKFRVRFIKGFSGNRENFFQMHSNVDAVCPAGPPIMIKFHQGKLVVAARHRIAESDGRTLRTLSTNVKLSDLIGKWQSFKLVFDTSNEPIFALYLNEQAISFKKHSGLFSSNIPYYIQSCGKPHFKFGIYRPGNWSGIQDGIYRLGSKSGNNHSIVDFDKINLQIIEENIKPRWIYCWNPNGENASQDLYKVSGKCKSGHDPISLWRYDRLQRTPYCWNEDEKKAYTNINFCEGNDKALTRLRYRSLTSKKDKSSNKSKPQISRNYCYFSEINTLTKISGSYCPNGMTVTLEEGEALVKKGK